MGEPVQDMSEERRIEIHRSQIGFVFQNYHLIDDLTVYENLETPLTYKGFSTSERESKVAEMLDRFQLVAKKDLFPNQLSGGQQQLVGPMRSHSRWNRAARGSSSSPVRAARGAYSSGRRPRSQR